MFLLSEAEAYNSRGNDFKGTFKDRRLIFKILNLI